MAAINNNNHRQHLDQDPFWYKNGVIYELHVRAFFDANGDGTGDFRGLTEKLDYIKDLGVTAIWLLPFYPSPLKDDGYDIADYYNVHPMYGTLGDFKIFLREAHRRGLRVITELVLNHTSDQHPWFQRSRRAKPGSRWRDFYVWNDNADKYQGTPIIFNGVELSNWTLDPIAKAYYWHRFFSHQPDLNFDNPEVHDAIFKVVEFWLDLGVDGLRLDAVPYLYEREGTNCESLPETHAFLKKLRAHVDTKYGDRMLLGEANLWPEDAVTYFGQGRGDECHMAFHFPLMPRLFMALRMEDRLPITDILEQTPAIPETSQWALFLRNHDELTLATVTDEERDYMYRVYTQTHHARLYLGIRRRLAPLLGNDRKSMELLNALLFSLPGTPVLYYGDEIGLGENVYLGDRNGVRTPMQWSSDKNAGFSRANPQSLYLPIILDPAYHYEACNVETQLASQHSLLWWMRRMLALRKRWRALGEGKCEFLQPDNHKILAYVLRYQQEIILVVANLSRFVQPVELDLSAFKQCVPVELFGRTEFPVITDKPYFLTLGPHGFFWFSIEAKVDATQVAVTTGTTAQLPVLTVTTDWQEVLAGKSRARLEAVLPAYLKQQNWFEGRFRTIKTVTLKEALPIQLSAGNLTFLNFIQVEYVGGGMELYALPLAYATGDEAAQLQQNFTRLVIASVALTERAQNGILYDALASPLFGHALLKLVLQRSSLKNDHGDLEGMRTPELRRILGSSKPPEPVMHKAEQDNSSLVFGDKLILKFFRRLEPGTNPELEVSQFLATKEFAYSPLLAGALEYSGVGDTRFTLAVVHEYLTGARTTWDYTLDTLSRYYDRVISWVAQGLLAPPPPADPLTLLKQEIPPEVVEGIGTYLEAAKLLGERTGALHLALSSEAEAADFAPEPITPQYRRSLFQTMRAAATQNLRLLRKQLKALPVDLQSLAQRVVDAEPTIIEHYRQFSISNLSARRIRIHGDLHLKQVLWTGKDFSFVDFESENTLALSERRIKRSPLRDVASLVRSFHHAAYAGLLQHIERGGIPPENLPQFESWVRHWNLWVSVSFLKGYLNQVSSSGILPSNDNELRAMLRAYWLNNMMIELGSELNEPTGRLRISMQGIFNLMESQNPAPGTAPIAVKPPPPASAIE